jgi:hypothetical protein
LSANGEGPIEGLRALLQRASQRSHMSSPV